MRKSLFRLSAMMLLAVMLVTNVAATSTLAAAKRTDKKHDKKKKNVDAKKVKATCVNAECVRAERISADNLCVRENAQIAGNVNIAGNLNVSGEINPITNPFHGWWRRVSKVTYDELYYINAKDNNSMEITFYGGDLANQYQYDSLDSEGPVPLRYVNDRVCLLEFPNSQTRTVEGITGTFPQTLAYSLTIQKGGEFDGMMFFANPGAVQNETYQLSAQGDLDEKLKFDLAVGDQIRPWGNGDNAFPDSNSRRFMFEQLNWIFFENNTPALSPAGEAERLMERPERLALFNAIMDDGVARDPVDLYSIHKTTKGSGTTTLFTIETYPYITPASTVRLSGLAGAWAVLNGQDFQCGGMFTSDMESVEEQAPFFLPEIRTYHIVIQADTSLLPTFDPAIHAPTGAVIQPSQVGPITEDIEYREWIDAAIFYTRKVYQMSTHSAISKFVVANGSSYADTEDAALVQTTLATWEDVSNAILENIPFARIAARYKAVGVAGAVICPAYYLPYWTNFLSTEINEPFLALGVPGSSDFPAFFPPYAIGTLPALGFNVPFENYLLPESRRWLYFRVQPNTPVNNAQQANVWVYGYDENNDPIPAYRGYASVGPDGLNTNGQLGGSRFEGLMSSVPWGDNDPEILDGFWSPYTNNDPDDPQTFNAGIINPAFVDGRKIGYITFANNFLHDQFALSLNINFGNPALASNPDPEMRKRQQYDGESAIIAALMRYFVVEQQVEAMIIDNRVNSGNFNTQSFLEGFGGSRLGGTSFHAFQNQDNRDAFNVDKEIDIYAGTRENNRSIRKLVNTTPWPTVRPDLFEQRYPGAVFKNGPVIMLDSQSAGSGGDQISRYFIGDNLDGDIGAGVQTHIVGTIDGILQGYSASPSDMIRSRYGSEFPDSDGVGQSPLTARGESLLYNEIAGAPTSTRYDPRSGFVDPIQGLIPVNSNMTGPLYASTNTGTPSIVQGALSTNIGDVVYFDFGYTGAGSAVDGTPYGPGHWDNPPTGITQVGGFPGQPNPSDLTTLRDSWLEEALRVTQLALGPMPVAAKVAKAKPVVREVSKVAKQAKARFANEDAIKAHVKKKQDFMDRVNSP